MSEIRLQLSDYLKSRGLNAEKLLEAVGDAVDPEIIYQLVEKDTEQRQIDLSILATVLDGLSKLNGFPVGVGEVLVFLPDISDEDLEKSPWRELYLDGEIPPYDWENVDPLTIGKPVRYIPGVGGVIVEDEAV